MTDRSITVGSWTPWGWADSVECLSEDIWRVTTPSHGGYYVANSQMHFIDDRLLAATFEKLGEAGWFEEDVDWCIVPLSFPDRFDAKTRDVAGQTYRHWIKPKLTQAA